MSKDLHIVGFGSNYFHHFGDKPDIISLNDSKQSSSPEIVIPNLLPSYLIKKDDLMHCDSPTGPREQMKKLLQTKTSAITQIEIGATSITILTNDSDGSSGNVIYTLGTICGSIYKFPTPLPTRLPLACTKIASGRRHVLALMEGGQIVMSWGSDHFGQLGHGSNTTQVENPRIIQGLLPMYVGGVITDIAAGGLHSAAVVSLAPTAQKIFTWGFNNKNQCGMESGKSNYVPHPQPVCGLPPSSSGTYRKLALGKLHSVALTSNGDVYSWGSTTLGKCGFPSSRGIGKQNLITLPKKIEGALANNFVQDIACGDKHTLALTENGKVYSWGCGEDGQLGHGVSVKKIDHPKHIIDIDFSKTDSHGSKARVESIYAGGSYSAAMTNTKDVFTWGYGSAGQLGHIPSISESSSLPNIDPVLSSGFDEPIRDSQSFLSSYNILLPKRIKCIRDAGLDVHSVVCGPSNMILLCSDENEGKKQNENLGKPIPQTLYEFESMSDISGWK